MCVVVWLCGVGAIGVGRPPADGDGGGPVVGSRRGWWSRGG